MANGGRQHVHSDHGSHLVQQRPTQERSLAGHEDLALCSSTCSVARSAPEANSGRAMHIATVPLVARDGTIVDHATVDAGDETRVRQGTWRRSSGGYAVRSETTGGKKRTIYLHRLIAEPPAGVVVDHANGIKLDNRRCNLRWASVSQNNANGVDRRRRGSFRGVYWHKPSQKWVAQISVSGRLRHLGLFKSDCEAAAAYNVAAQRAVGLFARLNPA